MSVIAVCAVLVLVPAFGARTVLAVVAVGSLAMRPVAVMQWSDADHPGIAEAAPVVYPSTVIVLLGCLALVRRESLDAWPRPLRLFLGALLFGVAVVWPATPEAWAGIVHLGVAVLAALLGASVAGSLDRDAAGGRILVAALAFIAAAQVLLSLWQLLQPDSVGVSADGELLRVHGTFAHPGDMGKALVILLIPLLPLSRATDVLTRRLATVAIAASIVAIGMSVARANVLAAASMLLLWAVMNPRRRTFGRRAAAVLVVGACFLPFAGPIVERFRTDPEGGSRVELTAAALDQISRAPWWGTGPNAYVTVVGNYDRATSFGLPVHNSVLLLVAELGIPIAALFLLGVLSPYLAAWRRRRVGGAVRDHAVALLVSLPALLMIGLTGWGLLKQPILPLWLFVLGFVAAQLRRPPADAPADPVVGTVVSTVVSTAPRTARPVRQAPGRYAVAGRARRPHVPTSTPTLVASSSRPGREKREH